MEERLQKIIARAGVASRRHAEQLIASGLVTVNGQTITELGTKADAERDHIKVAGKLVRARQERIYLAFHKPPRVVATMSDPEGRRSVSELLAGIRGRVFPIGRLEYHASGLLLLTSDGEFADRVLRGRGLEQAYQLKLKSLLSLDEIKTLARATGARIGRVRGRPQPWYEVVLGEARRDSLRDRLIRAGHPVEHMRRVRIGPIELGALPAGEYRELKAAEVAALGRALERPKSRE